METRASGEPPELVAAFHVHSNHLGYDLRRAANAFALIQNLSGNGVRIELSWFDVEPEQNVWDQGKMAWYKQFCQVTLESFGITPVVNLAGNPPWAARLLRSNRRAFIHHWRTYCERAVEMMDGNVRFVQVWNEPNNPVLQLVERAHAHVGIFNQGFFHEMLNVAAEVMRPAIHPLELIINVTSDLPNWERFVTGCIRQSPDAFDIIGLDWYRSAYLPGNLHEFRDLERLLQRVNDPLDVWSSKQAALMEIGFSTFLPPLLDEARQREWADGILGTVRRQNQFWQKRRAKSLRLISWYQLFDEATPRLLSFLGHFGIVRLPDQNGIGQRKLAFDTVERHLRALRDDAAQSGTRGGIRDG